ncbi:MAG: methyltransferase domain-containing protein [Ruthenibacterium sp.]
MSESVFCCPLCGSTLKIAQNGALYCARSHCFDMAHEGYVHLLPAGKMHAKIPGDSKEMVAARRSFLQTDGYRVFADALCKIVCAELAAKKLPQPLLVDAGCGEGYYTRCIENALKKADIPVRIAAFDISKSAVKAAAKLGGDISYAVASSFSMPIADKAADILVDVFSPLAESEFARAVKPDGLFVFAVPGPRHLFGLKEILYDKPYENAVQDTSYEGFIFEKRIAAKGMLTVTGEQIQNLFAMTPYYWKTPRGGAEKLAACERLTTEIHFDFLCYRRQKK